VKTTFTSVEAAKTLKAGRRTFCRHGRWHTLESTIKGTSIVLRGVREEVYGETEGRCAKPKRH